MLVTSYGGSKENPENMGIFESKPLRDLMDYRWETFGHKLHYIGAFFHFLYVIIISAYVNNTFFEGRYG